MRGITQNERFGINRSRAGLLKDILPSAPSKSKLYDVNIENLKTVIEYLTHLKNIEKLTDKKFSVLITRACANFIENEMASVINKVLVKDLKEIFGEFRDE